MTDVTEDSSTPASPNPSVAPSETSAAAHSVSRPAPRWAVIGIFVLLLVASIAYARVFLMPVVLGFLLALIFSPVRRFMDRRGLPSAISALIIVGVLMTMMIGSVLSLAEPVRVWVEEAPEIGRQLEQKVQGLLGSAKTIVEAGKQVDEVTNGRRENAQEVVIRKPGVVANIAFVAPSMVAQAIFTLVLLLFLLMSGDMFYEKLVHVMPTFRDKRRAVQIAHDIERKLSRYLLTITAINLGLGFSIGVAMWLLGMPNPLLFGVIGFLFNYVPYLGAVSGVAIATVVGLVTFDQLGDALLPGAVFLALTTLEGQFVTPYFVGRRLEMNSVVIFLSVAFWAWLWSIMGMLIAVPLLVAVRAFCEHIPVLAPLGDFLSARGGEKNKQADTPQAT